MNSTTTNYMSCINAEYSINRGRVIVWRMQNAFSPRSDNEAVLVQHLTPSNVVWC